jgi:Xaa-Pro aminopeptidase
LRGDFAMAKDENVKIGQELNAAKSEQARRGNRDAAADKAVAEAQLDLRRTQTDLKLAIDELQQLRQARLSLERQLVASKQTADELRMVLSEREIELRKAESVISLLEKVR